MKLSFHSQILNDNTYHFPHCHKIFQLYKMNIGHYVRHIEQLQKLLTDRFVDFDKNRRLFRRFANPLKYHTKTMNILYCFS